MGFRSNSSRHQWPSAGAVQPAQSYGALQWFVGLQMNMVLWAEQGTRL